MNGLSFVNNWRWSKQYIGFVAFNVWIIPGASVGFVICNIGLQYAWGYFR